MDEKNSLDFYSCIGLSITEACPITCGHCIMSAGPAKKTNMKKEDAANWLKQAAEYRNHFIRSTVITGGEPFYDMDLLRSVLRSAENVGLIPAVVTNAFWATTALEAVHIMTALPQIKMLTISTDVYHQKYIPIKNVEHAVIAAKIRGIGVNLALCKQEDDESSSDFITTISGMFPTVATQISTVYPAGRAKNKQALKTNTRASSTPAGFCAGAEAPTIFPDGKVVGCMGIVHGLPDSHPMVLGNINTTPLSEIIDNAECNAFLHMLRLWGPQSIVKELENAGFRDELPNNCCKGRTCDLCYFLARNPDAIRMVNETLLNPDLREKVAYGRQFYFNETEMLRRLQRNEELQTF